MNLKSHLWNLGSIALIAIFSLCSITSASEMPDWKTVIRESQIHLANAEPEKAEAGLIALEKQHPEIRKEALFCYQRFFVALEGRGDRATAKVMLQRLNHLVETDALKPNSNIYLSVTEAWHRSLLFTDSDLIRRANKIMADRLNRNASSKP